MDPRIEKIFFGTSLNSSFDRTIITNISPVYTGISAVCGAGRPARGLYENAPLSFRGLRFRLVRITPGSVVIDVVKILKGRVSGVYIVGIAGALKKGTSPGAVVYPSATVTPDVTSTPIALSGSCISGTICQTDGLLQTRAFYRALRRDGVDYLDMESYSVASQLKGTKTQFSMAVIVSDLPLSMPFYAAPRHRPEVDYAAILARVLAPAFR